MNLRFVAEVTDGDPPLLRARCTELDVAIAIDTSAYERPERALSVLVVDAVNERIPADEDRRVIIDVLDAGARYRDPTARRMMDVQLRQFLALLTGARRAAAFREIEPAGT